MTIGEWFLGSATLLLALGAFWAIWQDHCIRVKERKARLLNEILQWAKEGIDLYGEADLSNQPYDEMKFIKFTAQSDAMIIKAKEVSENIVVELNNALPPLNAFFELMTEKALFDVTKVKKGVSDCAGSCVVLFDRLSIEKAKLKL